MNALRVIGALALAGILAVLWGQHRQIGLQSDLIAAQSQTMDQLQTSVGTLKENSDQNRQQMAQLLQAQQRVQASLVNTQTEIRRLQTDDPEIRDWADQPLPDGIQRMLKHPAATGAAGYRPSVPGGDPLHDVRGGPEKKR